MLTNGTAVLGLGAIGPLAGKPVMEGKAVLFKKFAGVDVFDIEVNETDVDKLVDIIVALEPTFGGIDLEDIEGAGMFRGRGEGEGSHEHSRLPRRPARHRDHRRRCGDQRARTRPASISRTSRSSVSGAGAAALASLNLLVSLGARRESIFVCDIVGVVYQGREELMDRWKAAYAQKTSARKLADVIDGADIFLGLSAAGVLTPEQSRGWRPIR